MNRVQASRERQITSRVQHDVITQVRGEVTGLINNLSREIDERHPPPTVPNPPHVSLGSLRLNIIDGQSATCVSLGNLGKRIDQCDRRVTDLSVSLQTVYP